MRKILMILWFGAAAADTDVHAQAQLQQFLKNINTLDRPNVAYTYKVQLCNMQTKKVEDSIVGKICKLGSEYVDSSNAALIAVSGKYYCKIDHQRKEATVYDIELIQKKLNLKVDRQAGHALAIPDSLLLKYGRLTVDTGKTFYTCKWTFNSTSPAVCSAIIEKTSFRLIEITLETVERDAGENTGYKRICTIRNINNDIPYAAITLDNIFRLSGDKVVLNKKYADYNLRTIINDTKPAK